LYIAVFLGLGLIFGSFLNVCIYRMPRELSVVAPRSQCPSCGMPIAFYDNIPVLSWIILGGKCRNCGGAISPRYVFVELLTGVFFLLSYLSAGASPAALKLCVLSFFLLGLIFTDAETKLLPDLLTKPGIVLGLVFSLFVAVEGPAGYFLHGVPARWISGLNSLAGMLLGAAFILGIALLYEAVRGVEGMGRGDVKLMALVGAFLGIRLTLVVLLLGSLIGSVFGLLLIFWVWLKRLSRRRRRVPGEPAAAARGRAWRSAILIYRNFEIPFGVFLGAAALFAAFWGDSLWRWYARFSGLWR
jgi:leader peptidase (prepilin peptidase)/N-methyltransferase